jgi:hypothetical protein
VLERTLRVECTGPLADELVQAATAVYADLDGRPAVFQDADLVMDSAGRQLPGLLEELSQRLTQWGIEQRRGELLMLHAAAVADPVSGATVAFVGPSGAGKSTAARVLGRDWGYLGDEVVALRDDHSLVPLRRPLALLTPDHPEKALVPADRLGLRSAPASPWLAGLVVLDRQPGAELAVERLLTIDALPLLAAQTSFLASFDRPLHRLAAAATAAGGVRRATYGEAEQLGELVADLVQEANP